MHIKFAFYLVVVGLISGCVVVESAGVQRGPSPLMTRSRTFKSIGHFESNVNPKFGKAEAVELGAPTTQELGGGAGFAGNLLSSEEGGGEEELKMCYFDRRIACPHRSNRQCHVDERPCASNRDYFDHIYAPNKNLIPTSRFPDSDSGLESENDDNTLQFRVIEKPLLKRNLSRKQLRAQKKKLMLMSTWVEDLLPDPYQGQDLLINMIFNSAKFSVRITIFCLYALHKINKVHFPKPKYLLT